jgi:peptidoglycan/xylan/chitin deacetylase (PgdA/CDA1 family)
MVALALLALWLGLAHLGSFYAPSGIFGQTLLHGPSARPLVALTFDDGPDPETTPRVLELLARHGARATFFVIGERAARYPEVVAAIAKAGHQIESHSLRHSWWTAFTPRHRLAAELRAAQVAIAAASGREPRWFRPPIGILSPEVVAAAQRVGLRLCGWSCKARDGLAGTSVGTAVARLSAGLRPGAILLLHDAPPHPTRPETAGSRHQPIAPAVLEQLLPQLVRHGLRAVTLDELLLPGA